MDRITNTQMSGVLTRYARSLKALGMCEGELRYDEGSKTNGRAYRLFFQESGMPVPGTIDGYLGMTKREAYYTLCTMALTLEAVSFHRTFVEEL